jgi:hypothetical protein
MRFVPSRTDRDLWINKGGDGHYEYIGVFVDDILVFSPDPKEIFEKLKANYKYEFKDIKPITNMNSRTSSQLQI